MQVGRIRDLKRERLLRLNMDDIQYVPRKRRNDAVHAGLDSRHNSIAVPGTNMQKNGIALSDICVVARTKKLVDDYIAQFTRAGIRSYAIKRNKTDDRNYDGLRVATMHRVKGLEFQYVFVAAVNNRILPLPSAINHADAILESETMASEKCLLYVSLTRAQKGAYITCYGKKSDFL